MLHVLLRPFGFLTVKHPSRLAAFVVWCFPIGVSFLITTALALHLPGANLFGSSGLIDKLLNFIQTLTGFYMAGLAAICSFNSNSMDTIIPGAAPKITIRYNGKNIQVDATRRRFLSSMFAYLTATSFLLTIASILLVIFPVEMKLLLPNSTLGFVKYGVVFTYLSAVSQLILVTFWGLYYMGEKMLTPH